MRILTLHFTRGAIGAVVAGSIAALVPPAWAQQSSSSAEGQSRSDSRSVSFIKQAAHDNDLEVAIAELGARKAQNPELKNFCQQLQQDHTKANEQLKPLAQKYGVNLDQSLKHKGERELTKFEKESPGGKFDQKLAIELMRDHEKDIRKFQQAASQSQATDVRQYAETMLPQLRQHFQHAETVARAVGVDQSTISSISKKMPAAVGGAGEDQQTSKGAGAKALQPGAGTTNKPSLGY
jgi:putative membrane protein